MATTKEQLFEIIGPLSEVGSITFKTMMGEYLIYERGKLVGGIYDGVFLVKPTATALRLYPEADRRYPYAGSKTLMVEVDPLDDSARLKKLFDGMNEELNQPGKRKK